MESMVPLSVAFATAAPTDRDSPSASIASHVLSTAAVEVTLAFELLAACSCLRHGVRANMRVLRDRYNGGLKPWQLVPVVLQLEMCLGPHSRREMICGCCRKRESAPRAMLYI